MNAIGFLFTLINCILIWVLPRRLAILPVLIGAAYMTRGQILDLGPLHFPVIRIIITVGLLRAMSRHERIVGGINRLDRIIIWWSVAMIITSIFHTSAGLVFRAGLIWTELGSYILLRIFLRDLDDIERVFKYVCILLIPVMLTMVFEKITGRNLYSDLGLGGVRDIASFRGGKFRAQGPFAHAILAGTVGAICFGMALFLWRNHRKIALIGIASTGGVTYASGSSGPAMSAMAIFGAMLVWRFRDKLKLFRWGIVLALIALNFVMKDPVYYLLARIDITGGSTGWHRAALIHSSITHLDEWWLYGTDYTRHWMPTGVHANEIHTDITNHYLQMGVWGGLPVMFLFIWILVVGFGEVGRALRANRQAPFNQQFLMWTLGCMLFGHVTNFFSISYFDQSVVFLYLLLAMIGTLRMARPPKPALVPIEPPPTAAVPA